MTIIHASPIAYHHDLPLPDLTINMDRRVSTDHDFVTATEQDEAPVTPRTATSTQWANNNQTQTFDDLPSAALPLLFSSLQSPLSSALPRDCQSPRPQSSPCATEMTAPVNVSPTAVGAGGGYPQQPQPPQAYAPYPYAMSQGKEMYMQGGPTAAYRRQSRFDPMASEETDEEGYGELGQRHPLRRVQEEEREDGVSLPSIRNLFSVAGEKERASPVGGAPPGNAASTSGGPVSPVSSSPVMQDQRSRYSSMGGSTFSSVSDQFGWWQGPESERGRTESAMSAQANGPFRAHSFPGAAYEEDHDAKRRRSDQPASMRDPEEAARLRWQAQNRNASYPASGSMAGNGLRSLIHPPHGSYRGSVSVNDGTGYPPPPPTHDDSMRPPNVVRNGSVGSQLAHSFAELSAAEQSAIRNSASRSPSMAPPPAPSGDRRSSAFSSGPLMRSTPLNEAGRAGPPRQSAPGNLYDPSDPARRQSVTQPPSPSHQQAMRQASMNGIYAIDGVGPIDPNVANLGAVDMDKPSMSEPSWSRRTSAAETHATGIHLGSDSDGSTAKGSRGKKRGNDDKAEDVAADGDSGMGGMDVLAESAERAEAAAAGDEAAERDPSPPRNGTGPKYTCSYCQKTFSRPSSLRIHTYSQPSCGRRFSVQSNLKRHAKVHALVNQQEADRLRAMYSHHNNQPRHPDGLPPMQHQHQHHMQHQQQMGGPMGGMPPPGPAPPPHIMNVRDPRMYGGPGMHTPGQPFSSVPPHAGGMPTHGQQPVMPYGYPGMPNMHPAPGMNPQGPPASAPPPQMPVDGQHGYSNYSFYDSQGGAGMSNYGQPPQQHPHTLPPPMSGPPHQQAPPPGYHMATGVDMADPYQYQKN